MLISFKFNYISDQIKKLLFALIKLEKFPRIAIFKFLSQNSLQWEKWPKEVLLKGKSTFLP